MPASSRRFYAATISLCALQVSSAQAQSSPTPDFVVTATRSPLAISQAGSAITVITADEIEQASPKSLADTLRRAPGLSVVESGGPGSTTTVRIRGGESRHTLVLIDGVRVNDPTQPGGEFDFASLVPTSIERIEVLRGPQSALYGSDAMGGVINIITRKGRGAPRLEASTEVGSYGSKGARAGISGSTGPLSYAFSLTGYDTAGFSRYGYNIGRIERTRLWPLEADATRRLGAAGRLGITLGDGAELEFGGFATLNDAQYDAVTGDLPDSPSSAQQRLFQGYSRLTAFSFGGLLRNTLLVSANRNDRDYRDVSSFGGLSLRKDQYVGDRLAAEYQGDLKLGSFGLLTFGSRVERESLATRTRYLTPFTDFSSLDASQTTRSLFALHQISLWENLHLSFGGRIDDVADGDRFATWRATAAYEVPGTGTKFRSSIGTGGKAPSLFQKYAQFYGTPDLRSEDSVGVDAGVDQRLFDDRLTLSLTFFANRFRDLIDFSSNPADCSVRTPFFGCYVNRNRARTSGIELTANLDLIPQWMGVNITYTHLNAVDLTTGQQLPRRPEDEARVGFVFTPMRNLSIEPTIILVGQRYSGFDETVISNREVKLAPYARLDVYADYKINDTFSVFARAENLTNAHYQEVFNYGTAGRSFYGGLKATW